MGEADRGKMEVQEEPATPTGEFRAIDDTGTFEIFDGDSSIQSRKRRRSSLRRVSFAEQPLIRVFERDDDYETPPEGTTSHLSALSTPTSVSQSPQRRSERLAAARGGRQVDNEVDKENVPVSVGSNVLQSRRGRRPLALRDTQKEEEFLKPSNWLDDHENSAFGSCDDNSGPVDIRHITFDNQRVEVDDDDNMTMDSQTFLTRMSLMKQPLPRLSETTWTPGHRTPGQFTDMESIHEQHTETAVAWHDRQELGSRGSQVQEEPTWHRGDGSSSDMSFDELSVIRVLPKKRSAAKESGVHDSAENAVEGRDNWAEDDAESQGRMPSMEIRRTGPLLDSIDDAVSMDTSSPQSTGGRHKSLANEREQDPDTRKLRQSMSDVDTMEKYQEGITEAMPKLDFVLGGYNCDSPSAEPLNRILQRKSGIGGEDSPVYGVTAEIDTKNALPSREGDDVARSGGVEEMEIVSNRGLEEDTDESHFNMGKKRTGFQNPEDTFSFRGHQISTRETSLSPPMEQNVMPKPIFPSVRERVNIIEANLRSQSAPHNPERDYQDEDTTGEYTGQPDWRAEVSSDMSTTPLSPRRPNYLQRLDTKPQSVPVLTETGVTDSPSFHDGITAAIPNVQDLLDADARTPESEVGWNPRKIDWSAQKSTCQALGDEDGLRQPGIDKMEDETMHSMPDKLCTPTAQVENNWESQQVLRRTLQFQPEIDSQLQSRSLREDADQHISAEDPDGTMEVESVKNVDEETNSIESRSESLRQESRRLKLLQEMQVAEERLAALERRSEELRKRAQDCHKAVAKRCTNDSCFKSNESAAFCIQKHVSELKRQCQLLNCIQGWDLKTTKTGDNQVLHEFKYYSLLTHSIFERKENNMEATVTRSSIDLNEERVNQVYRNMNASLAWRWFLSVSEEVIQPQSLFFHVQGVNIKVVMLMELMEEVNKCRKYLVIPRFRLQTGTGLHLGIQFSDSKLLFDFVLLLDMRQVNHLMYSKKIELDCGTQINQKLDCTIEMGSAGRFYGKKITEAEIRSTVASVDPGRQLLCRVCASMTALFLRIKESVQPS